MQYVTVGGRQYLKYWHSDDPIMPKREAAPMTPEERAKSVLHFLDKYLGAREDCLNPYSDENAIHRYKSAREFLGTALVALVTEAQEPTKRRVPPPPCHPEATWLRGAPFAPNQWRAICSVCGEPAAAGPGGAKND